MDLKQTLLSGIKSRWIKFLAVMALVLLLLPVILQYSIRYAIEDYGLGKAYISDVDLNLFAGTFELKDLELDQGGEVTLVIGRLFLNYGWFGLGLTELDVEELTLENSSLVIYQTEEGIWHVIVPVTGDEGETQPVEDVNVEEQGLALPKIRAEAIRLSNVDLLVRSSLLNGSLLIDTFDLQRLSSFSDEPARLLLDAQWNQAPIHFDWEAEIIREIPRLTGIVRINDLQLADLQGFVGEFVDPLSGSVDIDLDVKAARRKVRGLTVEGKGSIDVEQLALGYQRLRAEIKGIAWLGEMTLDVNDPENSLQHLANITLDGLSVRSESEQAELLTLGKLTATQLLLEGLQKIGLESLQLDALDMLHLEGGDQADLRTGQVRVNKINLADQQRLAIDTIELHDGQYHMWLDAEGNMPQLAALDSLSGQTAGNESEPEAAEQPEIAEEPETAAESGESDFTLKLNQFKVLGDTYLDFEDRQFKPVVKARFSIREMSISALDQASPEQKSQLELIAQLSEFSEINISGWTQPFAEHRNTDLKGSLKAIELPPFSAYVEQSTGYQIDSGQLNHDFTLSIEQEFLDMDNSVQLKKFELEEVDAEKSESASKSMGVSLGLGLDLMRDGKGTIELDVPIRGQLDDPDLHLDSVITKAVGKAITKGSISFLKYAIQPYGAIVLAGEQLHKQMSSLDLAPVPFDLGSALLPSGQEDYLDKLVDLAADRPGLSLRLCGVASLADVSAMTVENVAPAPQSIAQLAKERAVVVKRYLVERGVDSGRLALCKARVGDEQLNGVEISL